MNTTTPTTSTMPHANSTLGAFFLSNPDALRVAWADLVAQHPHLHGPEVALRLGVPEAAMIAARIGHGAVELVPDLSAVLACGRAPVMRVGLQGRGLAVRHHGPLHKTMQTPGAVHASNAACKLHLRMSVASDISRLRFIDGTAALAVSDGEHGLLTLQAGHTPAEAEAWLQAIFSI